MCMCPSTNPGTSTCPPTSCVRSPSYEPIPATCSPAIATSAPSSSPVNTDRTRPPFSTASAGTSFRATARRCARSGSVMVWLDRIRRLVSVGKPPVRRGRRPRGGYSWRGVVAVPGQRPAAGGLQAGPAHALSVLGLPQEPDDPLGDLLAGVLLEEVAGPGDDLGRSRAGDELGEPLRDASREHRVRVAEQHEGRLVPPLHGLADLEGLRGRGMV